MGFILEYFWFSLSELWRGVVFPSLTKYPSTILIILKNLKMLLLPEMQKNSCTVFPHLTTSAITVSIQCICYRTLQKHNKKIIHLNVPEAIFVFVHQSLQWCWLFFSLLPALAGETTTTVAPFVPGGVSDGQWHSVQVQYYNKVRLIVLVITLLFVK